MSSWLKGYFPTAASVRNILYYLQLPWRHCANLMGQSRPQLWPLKLNHKNAIYLGITGYPSSLLWHYPALCSSQDHCMNLNYPCNLDPIFLSYKAFKGMVPQHVKNWPEYKQVFGRELHFSRESKTTLQGQIRTESLSPQNHFRAILRFHQHGYLREGWHVEYWPFSRWPSATGPLWKTLAGNSSTLLQISAPSSFHHLNYWFQNGLTTSCKVSQLGPKTDRAQWQHQAAVAAGPIWPRELSSQWWRMNSSEHAARFNSRKKWFCCYQKHVIVVSICRLFWKVTFFFSFFLAKQVLWIFSCSNSQVTQLSRLRQTRMNWVPIHRTALFSSVYKPTDK